MDQKNYSWEKQTSIHSHKVSINATYCRIVSSKEMSFNGIDISAL